MNSTSDAINDSSANAFDIVEKTQTNHVFILSLLELRAAIRKCISGVETAKCYSQISAD